MKQIAVWLRRVGIRSVADALDASGRYELVHHKPDNGQEIRHVIGKQAHGDGWWCGEGEDVAQFVQTQPTFEVSRISTEREKQTADNKRRQDDVDDTTACVKSLGVQLATCNDVEVSCCASAD